MKSRVLLLAILAIGIAFTGTTVAMTTEQPLGIQCDMESSPGETVFTCVPSVPLFGFITCLVDEATHVPCNLSSIAVSADDFPPGEHTLTIIASDAQLRPLTEVIPFTLKDTGEFRLECSQSSVGISCEASNGEVADATCDYNSGEIVEPCDVTNVLMVDFDRFEPGPLVLAITATSTDGQVHEDFFIFTVSGSQATTGSTSGGNALLKATSDISIPGLIALIAAVKLYY